MTLRLTPDMLASSYDFLRSTPPISGWRLPHSDDLAFRVAHAKNCAGWFRVHGDDNEIAISAKCVSSPAALLQVMAHEMIHLYQHRYDTVTRNTEHNAEFHRLAKLICRKLTFDYAAFV